ncbi:hypothetical protein KAFR_0C00680 [Kazachstania africana CBS 2517]|uniref:N-(5'-phosphoribosyl)anthranilate isomerase n=1 Tax=Kazachstania africana (strain ATCC 22294 / BCRC 22015 / CBS 2517 / CECT 1963 / NBRC 1671 / NRRL Y-8276) TaxID=1071382 RepID=H2ARR3_KAZAF|nr:hypothetical protein KAFR_0C00680 [Kazachstania africana CBS 2517]CCF57063.1 hypothetical protein KAFR_0C00680 [Kazachstania africana CBS 2517]
MKDFQSLLDSNEPLIKICGLQTVEAAQHALNSGTNFIGIICVPNRSRTIRPEIAREISSYIHSHHPTKFLVGVFRNQSKEDVLKLVNDYNIDIVQLHGDEDWEEYHNFIGKPIIKRVIFPRDCNDVIRINNLPVRTVLPLFDSEAGGTGEKLDWNSISNWSKGASSQNEIKFILAGGLTPDNVKEASSLHGVIGVDVSGGVETDNVKDFNKIETFIAQGKGL